MIVSLRFYPRRSNTVDHFELLELFGSGELNPDQ